MNVLVTGCAGYIGSHAVQRLLRDGHTVVGLDDLSRGHAEPMRLLEGASGGRLAFVRGDINERGLVLDLLRRHRVHAIMHFAALAYVGESVEHPLRYARANVAGLVSLLEAVDAAGVERFIFSSSCSTYGQPSPDMIPVPEHCPQSPISPYGRTKLYGEWILKDYAAARRAAERPFALALLRYFNVCGSDRTGVLGEDHSPETHLIPVVLQCALGQRPDVGVFGTDYPTPDGTCIRDYVHVEDLIDAHVRAMERLSPTDPARASMVFNVGIGRGYSVREIIDAARRVTGREIPVRMLPRREGDPPALHADPAAIRRDLGWKPGVTGIDDMIGSAWRWFSAHPHGYRS